MGRTEQKIEDKATTTGSRRCRCCCGYGCGCVVCCYFGRSDLVSCRRRRRRRKENKEADDGNDKFEWYGGGGEEATSRRRREKPPKQSRKFVVTFYQKNRSAHGIVLRHPGVKGEILVVKTG